MITGPLPNPYSLDVYVEDYDIRSGHLGSAMAPHVVKITRRLAAVGAAYDWRRLSFTVDDYVNEDGKVLVRALYDIDGHS